MKGKSRANEYCDVCKKIHRKGKCTELSTKEISSLTADAAMALIMRTAKGMYLNRDKIDYSKDFIESDVIKEGSDDESGRNNEKNK